MNNSAWFKRNFVLKLYSVKKGAKTFYMVAVQNINIVFMLYRSQRNKAMLQENAEF